MGCWLGREASLHRCRAREAVDPGAGRAQGYLKLPNGRALTGRSHDYKRHGTTTLFAALDVASGDVRAKFLDFMTRIVAEHPQFGLGHLGV
jgi:hypothetical protein